MWQKASRVKLGRLSMKRAFNFENIISKYKEGTFEKFKRQ